MQVGKDAGGFSTFLLPHEKELPEHKSYDTSQCTCIVN